MNISYILDTHFILGILILFLLYAKERYEGVSLQNTKKNTHISNIYHIRMFYPSIQIC